MSHEGATLLTPSEILYWSDRIGPLTTTEQFYSFGQPRLFIFIAAFYTWWLCVHPLYFYVRQKDACVATSQYLRARALTLSGLYFLPEAKILNILVGFCRLMLHKCVILFSLLVFTCKM